MSSQAIARERLLRLAVLMIEASLAWCSVTPGMVGRKAFCRLGFRHLLAHMCLNHLSFSIPESNLVIDGVSAIGRKFPGADGSSSAAPFGMSLTTANF